MEGDAKKALARAQRCVAHARDGRQRLTEKERERGRERNVCIFE